MAVTVGSLLLELGLDSSSYRQGMQEAQSLARRFYKESSDRQLKVKPTVDHAPLHELNRHLDRKEAHIDRLNRKAIKLKIDTGDLDRVESRLRRLQQSSIRIGASDNLGGTFGGNGQQLANQIGQAVAKATQPGLINRAASAVGNVAKIPLQLAGGTIGQVASGLTFGLTQEVSKNLGGGLSKAIESALGKSIGSTQLIGENAGAIGALLADVVGETFGDLLPASMQTRLKSGFQSIKQSVSKEAETLQDILKATLGEENIARESLYQRNQQQQQQQSRTPVAREQATTDRRDLLRNRQQLQTDLTNNQQSISTAQANYEKAENLNQRLNQVRLQRQSQGASESELTKLDGAISALNKEMLGIVEYEQSLLKAQQDIERQLKTADDAIEQQKKQMELVKPQSQPEFYRKALRQVAGQEVDENLTPQLVVADAKLRSQGARAAYGVESNTVQVTQELYDAIEAGKLTQDQMEDLLHELQHAADFEFGRFRGVEARRRGEILTTPAQASVEELQQIAPLINSYSPDQRGYEINAEVLGRRNAAVMFQQQQSQEAALGLESSVGYGGTNAAKAANAGVKQLRLQIVTLGNAAESLGVDISGDLDMFWAKTQEVQNNIKALQQKAVNADSMQPEEVEQIQREFLAEIERLEKIQKVFNLVKSDKLQQLKALQQQSIPLNIPTEIKEPELVVIELEPIPDVQQASQQFNQAPLPDLTPQSYNSPPALSEFTAIAPPPDVENMGLARLSSEVEAEHIARAKEISASFRSSYAQLKDALKKGDTRLAIVLAKTIQDNADVALQEIAELTAELGDAANFGTTLGNQLANTKAQIARTTNSSQQELIKARNKGQIEPDELSAQRLQLPKISQEQIADVVINTAGFAGSQLGAQFGIIGELAGDLIGALAARQAYTVGKAGVGAYQTVKADPAFEAMNAIEKFGAVASEITNQLKSEALQQALGSELTGDVAGWAVGNGAAMLGNMVPGLQGIPLKGAMTAMATVPQITKMRERVQARIDAEMAMQNASSDDELSAARLDLNKVGGKRLSGDELRELQELNQLLIEAEKNADRFDAAFGKLDPQTAKTLEESHQALRKTADELGNLEGASDTADGALEMFGSTALKAGSAILGLLTLSTLASLFAAIAPGALNAAMEFERFEQQLTYSTGSIENARDRMAELRDESNRLGTDMRASIAGYAQFAAATKDTTLEGDQTERIFSSVSQAGAVQQLDPQRQELVFQALSQMAGKGVISMEELRQQLGESLPGAMAIASRAMGMTTMEFNKLVESGGLMADEFLPKFAQQLAAESSVGVAGASQSAQANLNKLNNAVLQLQVTLGQGLMPARDIGIKIALAGLNALTAMLPVLLTLLSAVSMKAGVDVALSLLKMAGATVAASGGFFGMAASAKVAIGTIAKGAMAFAPFLAATLALKVAWDTFSLATQDAGDETRKFAEQATEGMAKYLELTGRAIEAQKLLAEIGKEGNNPENLSNRNNEGILEHTVIGGTARFVGGIFGKTGEEVNNGIRGYERAFADTYNMNTVGDVKADQQMQALDELLHRTNSMQSDVMSRFFDASGKAIGELARMQELDKQLQELQAKQAGLSSGDDAGRREIATQREALLRESEQVSASVRSAQESNATSIEMYKAEKEKIEATLSRTDLSADVRQQAEMRLAAVNSSLKASVSLSDRFAKNMTNVNTASSLLAKSLASINANYERAMQSADLESAQSRESTAQAQLSGITDGEAAFRSFADGQRDFATRLEASVTKLQQLRSEMNDPAIAGALSIAGLNARSTATEIRSRAEDFASAPETQKLLEAAAARQEEIATLSVETANMRADMAQAQVEAQQQLKQTSEEITSFYRDIQRNAQEIAQSADEMNLDATMTRAKAKLTNALAGFGNNFFSEFVDGMAELLQQLFEPVRMAMEANRQRMAANNSLADVALQSQQLLQGVQPMTGDSLTGAVIPGATGAVRSGLWTGESANIGGSSAFHIDTKINNNQSWEQVVGYFDQLAAGYAAENRRIEFSNSAVSGEVYDVNATLAEKIDLLQRAAAAHSHSVSEGYRSFDYYVPLQGRTRFDRSGNNNSVRAEMLLPNIPGARLDYDSGGRYGNYVRVLDANGNQIMRQGHGDDSRALPSDRAMPTASTAPAQQAQAAPRPQTASPAARPQQAASANNSRSAAEFIANFEGFHSTPYWDHQQWTNGFGTRARSQGEQISREEGMNRLNAEITRLQTRIDELVTVPINENQRTALTSFAYNLGDGALADSTLLRRLNSGDTQGAADEFGRWVNASGQRLPGLVTRRARERDLFLSNAPATTTPGIPQSQQPGSPGVATGYQFGSAQINEGLAIATQANEQQLAAIDNQLSANTEGWAASIRSSVETQRRALRDAAEARDDAFRSYAQQQEQSALELLGDSPFATLIQQSFSQTREFENANRDQLRQIRSAEEGLQALQAVRTAITEQAAAAREAGIPDEQVRQIESLIPGLDEQITRTQDEVNKARELIDDAQSLLDSRAAMQLREYQQQMAIERESSTRQSTSLMLSRRAAMEGLDRNEIGATETGVRANAFEITNRYEDQMRPLRDELEELEQGLADIKEQGVELSDEQLAQVTERTEFLNEQLNSLENQRTIELDMNSMELDRTMRQLNDDLDASFVESAATYMEGNRDTFGASALRETYAMTQEDQRYGSQMAGIDSLEESGRFSADQIAEMRNQAEMLNEVNLANIDNQFKDLGETLADIGQNSLGQFFNDILSGSKSAGEAFKDLISSILSQVAQLAVNSLLKDLFGGGGGLGGLFGGGGGMGMGASAAPSGGGMGGTMGTVMQLGMSLIGGMKDGGIVESADHQMYRSGYGAISEALKREGSGAVLAALTPGEVVLTTQQAEIYQRLGIDEVLNFKDGGVVGGRSIPAMSGGGSSGGSANINIPITIEGSSESDSRFDAAAMQKAVRGTVIEEMLRQKRQGGINR